MICPHCSSETSSAAEACFKCGKSLVVLTEGSVLASRYQIQRLLGRGGMGIVYRAFDLELDETVAVKVLRTGEDASPELLQRFRSEIKLARRVTHRNVCRINEYGLDGDLRFIAMEYIDGVDLKRIIRQEGLDARQAFEVSLQICEGLQAIHEVGILHRDLKTANIMRDIRGVVRLMDFGIAKQTGLGEGTGMTRTGQIVGTPEYMSPEQARGEKLDVRSDIYSLGIVLYEIFAGHVPFAGDTPVAVIMKHIDEPPPLDGPSAAGIPDPVVPVLRKALAKLPDQRYASVLDVAEALQAARDRPARFLPPQPRYVAPAPPVESSPRGVAQPQTPLRNPPRRAAPQKALAGQRRLLGGVLAILFGVAVALGVVAWGVSQRLRELRLATTNTSSGPAAVSPTPLSAEAPSLAPSASPTAAVPPQRQGAATESAPNTTPTAAAPPSTRAADKLEPPRSAVRPPPSVVRTPTPRPTPTPPPAELAKPGDGARGSDAAPAAVTVASGASQPAAPPSPMPTPEATTAAPVMGTLQVSVKPWAEVFVDGRAVGTTPFRPLSLEAGEHSVRLVHPGYHPLQKKVSVRSGETTRLDVDLKQEAFPKQ